MIKPDELKKLTVDANNIYVLLAGTETVWVKTYKGEVLFIYRAAGEKMVAEMKNGDLYIHAAATE